MVTVADPVLYFNRRGKRPGIYGRELDGSSGRQLAAKCAVFGVYREKRQWWIFSWYESDESLRSRTFLSYFKGDG